MQIKSAALLGAPRRNVLRTAREGEITAYLMVWGATEERSGIRTPLPVPLGDNWRAT